MPCGQGNEKNISLSQLMAGAGEGGVHRDRSFHLNPIHHPLNELNVTLKRHKWHFSEQICCHRTSVPHTFSTALSSLPSLPPLSLSLVPTGEEFHFMLFVSEAVSSKDSERLKWLPIVGRQTTFRLCGGMPLRHATLSCCCVPHWHWTQNQYQFSAFEWWWVETFGRPPRSAELLSFGTVSTEKG